MSDYEKTCPDMKERYDKVVLVKESLGTLQELSKPPFEQINSQAVTFREPLENSFILDQDKLTGTPYKTLHSFAYQGLFKPDLGEMLSQLPGDALAKRVEVSQEKIYVSVDLDWPNFCDVGEKTYHRGITTVWREKS